MWVETKGIGDERLLHCEDGVLPPREVIEGFISRGFGLQFAVRPGQAFDLAGLTPWLPDLRYLYLPLHAHIRNTRLLQEASSLRTLQIGGNIDEPVDLSDLPALRMFRGNISLELVSVLRNPHLTKVFTEGTLPPGALTIESPLRLLSHVSVGDREFPTFTQPGAMSGLTWARAERLDARQLAGFENLKYVRVQFCKELTNVHAFEQLPSTAWIQLADCVVPEGLAALPQTLQDVDVEGVRDRSVTDEWERAARERGWRLWWKKPRASRGRNGLFSAKKAEDGEGWSVLETDFTWLTDAMPELEVDAYAVEDLLTRMVEAQGDSLHLSEPEFDSEHDMFAVYFADAKSARAFAKAARTLAADPDAIKNLLADS